MNRRSIQILVAEGVDLEPKDEAEQTPLHLAARNGNAKIVKVGHLRVSLKTRRSIQKLISNNVAVDVQDKHEQTPLMLAAKSGNLKAVKVNMGCQCRSMQPCGWTCQVLIRAGANASAVDNDGRSPLLFASNGGHLEIVKVASGPLRLPPVKACVSGTRFACSGY